VAKSREILGGPLAMEDFKILSPSDSSFKKEQKYQNPIYKHYSILC